MDKWTMKEWSIYRSNEWCDDGNFLLSKLKESAATWMTMGCILHSQHRKTPDPVKKANFEIFICQRFDKDGV